MKYAWIAKHKKLWPVTLACEVLGVSTSGYFEHWRRKDNDKPSRPGANKRISDEALLCISKLSTLRSNRNTDGQKCGRNCWPEACAWAKSV